ncbi:Uncharacterised protein [Bordetella pertussis]|nr:Uncharacterised protein [Bordetella pertussis]
MAAMPTPPPAPERLDTTTGTPSSLLSCPAMGREKVSMEPPAGNGTMNVTGPAGQLPAPAGAAAPSAQQPASSKRASLDIPYSPCMVLYRVRRDGAAVIGRRPRRP